MASLLITWIIFTIGFAVSTSDNDQVKRAGIGYFNVKPAWPLCVVLRQCFNKQNTQSSYIYIYRERERKREREIKLDNRIIGYIHIQLYIYIQ